MPQCYLETRIKQIYLGEDIKRAYIGSELFFTRGQKVIYYIDEKKEILHEQEVEIGEDATKVYTPEIPSGWGSGWTFVGWREDKQAPVSDENVLDKKIISDNFGTEPIRLYGIFKTDIQITYNGNQATSGKVESQPGTVYWNASGTYRYPIFNLRTNGYTRTGYTFNKWGTTTTGGTTYSSGQIGVDTIGSNITLYALWNVNEYIINYDLKGGTQQANATTKYTINDAVTLPTSPTRTLIIKNGSDSSKNISVTCAFAGWYDSNGNKVVQITKGNTGNKKYTAKWSFASKETPIVLPTIQELSTDQSESSPIYTIDTTGFSKLTVILYLNSTYGYGYISCGNESIGKDDYDLRSVGEEKSKEYSITGNQGEYKLKYKCRMSSNAADITNKPKTEAWVHIIGVA